MIDDALTYIISVWYGYYSTIISYPFTLAELRDSISCKRGCGEAVSCCAMPREILASIYSLSSQYDPSLYGVRIRSCGEGRIPPVVVGRKDFLKIDSSDSDQEVCIKFAAMATFTNQYKEQADSLKWLVYLLDESTDKDALSPVKAYKDKVNQSNLNEDTGCVECYIPVELGVLIFQTGHLFMKYASQIKIRHTDFFKCVNQIILDRTRTYPDVLTFS